MEDLKILDIIHLKNPRFIVIQFYILSDKNGDPSLKTAPVAVVSVRP